MFNLFWCSKNPTSKILNSNGNGIGLFICKQICQGLGGDIEVHSSEDEQGSMFVFTMQAFRTQRNCLPDKTILKDMRFKSKKQGANSPSLLLMNSADVVSPVLR